MHITPERLIYLVTVAETRSFSAAARKLGVSPSAVSQVIQNMELDLGVRLFNRVSGQAPTLSDVGKSLYVQALEILPRLRAMEQKAQSYLDGVEDKLTIGVSGYSFFPIYSEKIKSLMAKFPQLTLNIIDVDEFDSSNFGIDTAADILITPAELIPRRGVESILIGRIKWLCVCAPNHPLAQVKHALSVQDLLSHIQITPAVSNFISDEMAESVRLSSQVVNCSRMYQFKQLLLSGVGFGLFPEPLAKELLESNQLVELERDFIIDDFEWPIEVVWSQAIGPAGEWFIEQLTRIDE
ncbi:transcriptional regulator [Agarivorans sp. Toyoura001]|uniref:LysR family transcriptional regulator n=1 Tax=Agarivorans sp. Toyoura001 TaxID=2283141 RepID=UPI0010D351B2|nr:LysR family transcriptional regulator [Agarivorans sp. Toyoura001]GDY25920.1 transcriptional regulator [Agarivorans sp. Toyoura001]